MIAGEPREKDSAGSLVLPETALAIIRAQDRIAENPYVFASMRGDNRPFVGFRPASLDAMRPRETFSRSTMAPHESRPIM